MNRFNSNKLVCYHVGLLMKDSVENPGFYNGLRDLKDLAMKLYENGEAILFQRKVEDGVFEYFCKKKKFK